MQVHELYFNKENSIHYLSRDMRNVAFLICENKCADQLRSNQTARQHLCFSYIISTMSMNLLFFLTSEKIKPKAIFIGRKPLFVSDIAGYLEDRFSTDME